MEQNKVTTYVLYALGEILLVVAGILIALQVNNWNEQKKRESFELAILQELDSSLEVDSTLIADYFLPRLERKERGIDSLKWYSGMAKDISPEQFMDLYEDAREGFDYRFNIGPYETIKSKGLELISNPELRNQITTMYELTFPAYQNFMNQVEDENSPLIEELEQEFLKVDLRKNEDNEWMVYDIPDSDAILRHPSFMRALFLEVEIAENYRSRLNNVMQYRKELHDSIRQELIKRNSI
ncbi:DUF6090 family protein [Balneola sp. MJW-20]|uniref:DUF6090 family protein n=1 Tax=Gracilimonas aurantiaca TaxID=3234185 RepID=UPI0034677B42